MQLHVLVGSNGPSSCRAKNRVLSEPFSTDIAGYELKDITDEVVVWNVRL